MTGLFDDLLPAQSEAKTSSVPVTYYSLGRDAGGPDEIQDKWTNRGYSSKGQNLTPGVAAVNDSIYPLGTIFRDDDTNEVFIATDRHGNNDPNVVDLFESPSRYRSRKEQRKLSVIGKADDIPPTAEGVRELLAQYGNLPPGESATDFLSGNVPPATDEDVIPLPDAKLPPATKPKTLAIFDDLIPGGTGAVDQPQQPSGLFQDLVPKDKQSDWLDTAKAFTGGIADSAVAMGQGIYTQASELLKRTAQPEADYRYRELAEGLKVLTAKRDAEKTTAYDARIAEIEESMKVVERQVREAYDESWKPAVEEAWGEVSDELAKERKEYSDFYNVDEDFQESFMGQLVGAAGQMVPQTVAAILPGVGLAALQSQAFQYSWDDAKETAKRRGEEFDPDKAFAYAMTNSFQQALLEKVGVDAALGRWLKSGGAMTLKEGLKRVLVGVVGEGGTEALQGGVEDALASGMEIESRNPLDVKRRATDFAIGGILGGGLSTTMATGEAIQERNRFDNRVNREASRVEKAYNPEKNGRFKDLSEIPASQPAPEPEADADAKYKPGYVPPVEPSPEGESVTQPTSEVELERMRQEGQEEAAAPAFAEKEGPAPDQGFSEAERAAIPQKAVDWLRMFKAVAPGAAAKLELQIASRYEAAARMAEIESQLGSESKPVIPETAHAAIHWDTVYLFEEALAEYRKNGGELTQGLRRIQHEVTHAWWKTLDQRTQDALTRLWKAETTAKTGPLYDADVTLRPEIMDHTETDVREWFSERAAMANDEWAQRRGEIADHDGTPIGRASSALRGWLFDARQAIAPNLSRDVIADEFRKVLRRGKLAQNKREFSNGTVEGPALFSVRAHHGTPYKVNRFSTDKIGTGEGAQAYGWGLYFAENENIAKWYRDNLASKHDVEEAARAIEFLRRNVDPDPEESWGYNNPADYIALAIGHGFVPKNRGNIYSVNLAVEPEELLDWDKPFSQQSPQVQSLVRKAKEELPEWFHEELMERENVEFDELNGREIYESLSWLASEAALPGDQSLGGHHEKEASEYLARLGIPGTRYLDAGSRKTAGSTYNFVIFDESKIKVTHENGRPFTLKEYDSHTTKATGESEVQFARAADPKYKEVDQQWWKDFAAAQAGALRKRHMDAGPASDELVLSGFPATNIVMRPWLIGQKSGQDSHPFPASLFFQLPRKLRDPIMVFKSKSMPDARTVLTELQHEGKNLLVAVHFVPTKDGMEIANVASVYPKESQPIHSWIREGLATYYHKEKARNWLSHSSAGSNSPQTWFQLQAQKNVATNEDVVKNGPQFASKSSVPPLKSSPLSPVVEPILRSPVTRSKMLSGKTVWDFANPIGNLTRYYMGTADIFEKTKGLEFLGRAIRKHVDTARRYYGQMTSPFRKWHRRHKGPARRQALKEFEGYWRENERNKPLANSVYSNATPAGRELIDLWKDVANEAGAINQANNVMVWDGDKNTFRPIGRVGPEYFPRMLRPEALEILRNPSKNPRGWEELVREMVAEGIITKPEEAAEYASNVVRAYRSNNHFGAIEHARSVPLPTKAYDYSFETARKYIVSWSERMAQIEAYGQKSGTQGKDLFDKAQEIAGDDYTKGYISRVQARAYNASLDNAVGRIMTGMQTVGRGLQLGNWRTSMRNFIGGVGYTAQQYGVRRTLGGLLNVKKTFDAIEDAYEKGILSDDLLNVIAYGEDGDGAGLLQKTSRGLMKIGLFDATEKWARGVNVVAARSMLRDALRANEKNPLSRKSLQYRGYFARIGIRSPQALLDEKGKGALTDQYLRAAVNEIQGGYRFDQVPAFMDTPEGRFLLQYQKWGAQQLRHFHRNVVNPFVQAVSFGKMGTAEYVRVRDPKTGEVVTKRVPGAVAPMARYMIILALLGAGQEKLEELLWGIPEREASWSEVLKRLDKDEAEGLGMVLEKLWGYHLLVGSTGLLGNYAQIGQDFTQRSRFKNPLDPPALAPLKEAGGLFLDYMEQGKITPENINEMIRRQFSIYRTSKQMAAQVNDILGGDFRTLKIESRRQDQQWLRNVTARYNEEIGVERRRTSPGRIGKSPQSPFRDGLKMDLLLGDTATARERFNEWLRGMTPERRKIEMTSLMASIRASQPIKAGYGSEAMRINFLGWARENLSTEDVQRVKDIDNTYRKTAIALGLLNPREDITDTDLAAAMKKIQLKASR